MWYNHRMKTARFPSLFAILIVFASCGGGAPDVDPVYRAEIEAAWAEREARLTADDGWLTVVGLFWLDPGPNIVGSAEDVAVRLPDGPALVGSLHLGEDGVVTLLPSPDAGLTVNDEPAVERALATDASGAPDTLRAGRVLFYLIERDDGIGVRVKDPEAKTRREFFGIEHFPVTEAFRVTATLERYPELKEVEIPTVTGTPSVMHAPGLLRFTIDGTECSLEPYVSGPEDRSLFLIFRDATSGDTTYGAGRFLYAELDVGSDDVILDFNLAINPPCAYTHFATCPLPTPENTVFVPISAGEKYAGDHH
jgi:uncharacterized protein (DUF1684 family)